MMAAQTPSDEFLSGGGEMGELTRAFDWSATSLGSPSDWPQSLRVTVRLILNTRHPMFIWWGPALIQFYNDGYRQTLGPERHPSALGQRGRECWTEIWDIIGPQIDYVMAGKGSTWDEDRLVPVTRNGRREDVWWTYSYSPIDVEGGIGGVLVVCNDVTSEHLAREALRNRTGYLMRLFEQAPSFMAVLRGPDHVFEFTNAAYRQLVGDRDFVGKPVRDVVPEAAGQGFFDLLDEVFRSGVAHVGRRTPLTINTGDGLARHVFLDFVYAPIFESPNKIIGVFVEGSDVSDHVRVEDHLRLMNDELQHRVKNTLTVVSAIAAQTLRGTSNDGLLKTFQGRLTAFAKAHDSLTSSHWAAGSIRDVVVGALTGHAPQTDRLTIEGPNLIIGAKQALSLALAIHELATNATKYGALSNEKGRITLSWTVDSSQNGGEAEGYFRFVWKEAGGPPVAKPSRQGFGSRLIAKVLMADFGGEVDLDFAPEGLICRLTTSLDNLRLPATLGNSSA